MPIIHRFSSAKADGGDATLVRASNWNANHNFQLEGTVPGHRRGTTEDRWYPAGCVNATLLTAFAIPALDTLRVVPFVPSRDCTLEGLAVNVTNSAINGEMRVGVYADDGNLYPAARLYGSAALLTTTTGVKSVTGLTQALTGGTLYWIATVYGVALPSMRGAAVDNLCPILGSQTNLLPTGLAVGWTVAFTYAALPDPFTASATSFSASHGLVYLRLT